MASQSKAAAQSARLPLESIADILIEGALPGEVAGFDEAARTDAAAFVAETARQRMPNTPAIRIESIGGGVGERRMRVCIVNDDMPFLVDSVAAALAARDIIIHRLLHPVVCATRDDEGQLKAVERACPDGGIRESVIYLEADRVGATDRRALERAITEVLADVRFAVSDWSGLQARMRADAEALAEEEAALLQWFADGAMTLLGHEVQRPGRPPEQALGVLRIAGETLWDPESCRAAIAYFNGGGAAPLLAKADRRSPVHRRVPLDLVILPIAEDGTVTALSVHAALWTSQAMNVPAEEVPVLRRRLAAFEQELGFSPSSHAGKALRHAVSALPRDLLVSLRVPAVKRLVMTAMSLADRPRPTIALLRSVLKGHLFAFVWLPRDELTTARRLAIGAMLEAEARGEMSSWAVELDDSDLALIRYTLDVDPARELPDAAELDRRIHAMVRGWAPSVEEALGGLVGATRARRLAITHVEHFPEGYRARTDPQDAAQDAVRLVELEDDRSRASRLVQSADEDPSRLRLKVYRAGPLIALSDAVPVLENFGFRVLEEQATAVGVDVGHIHEFVLELQSGGDAAAVMARAPLIEKAISSVLEGSAENDTFNQLLVAAGLGARDVVLLRAWFRYLRQTGLSYSMVTVVEALRRAPAVTTGLIALFDARHGADVDEEAGKRHETAIETALGAVVAIDEDRILRLLRAVVLAVLRTNAFTVAAREALAFKLDSAAIPGLPAPVPWREIWVYSPRVEGIHLRGGPVARGGLRWSDRRDDFRTEILGLMKAQVVKNAVIVPTGAKGGFYPKQLPATSDRDAWLAEGTESYRIFIRALLSVTDNIVEDKVVHPEGVTIRDEDDPYFVVAADKGTATFSDVANAIAVGHGFWLGDAFASGGSQGYDHKAMGITARGAWISVQRHFAEIGIDVQNQPIKVVGCGDMSGDVFGNGMLLSKALKLVAAFDHRHIFIDPDPDPARSWHERNRLFHLPRSSWDDYDKNLISAGGGVFPRRQKEIRLSAEARTALGIEAETLDPASLISAILRSPVDLIWFGGIGTYVKASSENNAEVGDHGNDAVRVDASDLRAKAIGEGANLAITQAGRIEFARAGGGINTDFIDNSAGVDCSDNEVNIKIPLNREMVEGRLAEPDRNALLAAMAEEVAAIVLEDNRLQTLALSIAEKGGANALPPLVRAIEMLEESGRLDREVEGLAGNEELLRRAQDNAGLTRPELAVLLSTSKMALQAAIEAGTLAEDPTLEDELMRAFPATMQARQADAIRRHRLRKQIIATKVANRLVNRLGITAAFGLSEEEGASLGQIAAAFVAVDRLFGAEALWRQLDAAPMVEEVRLELFAQASMGIQFHIADVLRSMSPTAKLTEMVDLLTPGLARMDAVRSQLLRDEARTQAAGQSAQLIALGAPAEIVAQIVRLFEMNGAIGIIALSARSGIDEIALTEAYTRLGEGLMLDWAQSAANRFEASDQWERLLVAGLAREFEQLRLDFLARREGKQPIEEVEAWLALQRPRVEQFRRTVQRARAASAVSVPMLAQIATQARLLLARN